MQSKVFWDWNNKAENGTESGRTLYIDGVIASEPWDNDDVTPKLFKNELNGATGDITLWINSPGGDVNAAAQIYTMLKEYSANGKGRVIVKIDGMAASAASVVAMAGDEVLMSPVSLMLIHNPWCVAVGDGDDMLQTKAMLDAIKESIISAYELKTGLPRDKISRLMTESKLMYAHEAVELGFANRVLYSGSQSDGTKASVAFSRQTVMNSLYETLYKTKKAGGENSPENAAKPAQEEASVTFLQAEGKLENKTGTDVESLYKRLNLLK